MTEAKTLGPAEGIFYVVRFPQVWEPVALRFDKARECGHPAFWCQQVVARLARAWSTVLGRPVAELESSLRPCEYAFPRSRVVKQAKGYVVFHGDDLEPFMRIRRRAIEGLFGIAGAARWLEDEHEHCLFDDKESARQILNLVEDWKYTDPERFSE